jgi:hypothetical protein
MINRPAINGIEEGMKIEIRTMQLTTPMYAGDIGKAIGYTGKYNYVRLVDVLCELVKNGEVIEIEGKYGYKKYVKACGKLNV